MVSSLDAAILVLSALAVGFILGWDAAKASEMQNDE